MIEIRTVLSERDVRIVADLAQIIWTDHYVPIIGQSHVDYMLEKFQSVSAITRQISEGCEYFLATFGDEPAGYLALIPDVEESSMMISKIYVSKDIRGTGLGRRFLDLTEHICRERGISAIWLTVNKNNSRSIAWYEYMGFRNVAATVKDIGNGFIMDDFKMVKILYEHD